MMFDHRLIVLVFTMCISHAAWAEDALVLVSGQIKNVKKSWGPHCPPTQDSEVDKPGLKYRVGVGSTLKPLSGQRPLFEPRICQKTTGLPSLREERSQTLITCHSAPEAARQVKGRITQSSTATQVIVTHTFNYNWRLHGSHCQLESRGKWVLNQEKAVARQAPSPQPNEASPCQSPGKPSEIKPIGRKKLKVPPQGRVRVRAQVVDKNGCPISRRIKWSASHGKIGRRGVFQSKKTPPNTLVTVTARSGRLRTEFSVVVTASAEFTGLIPRPDPIDLKPQRDIGSSGSRVGLRFSITEPRKAPQTESQTHLTYAAAAVIGLGFVLMVVGLTLRKRRRA